MRILRSSIAALLVLIFLVLGNRPVFAVEFNLEHATWRMLSLPGQSSGTVETLFGNALPIDLLGRTWALYVYDSVQQTYRLLEPGDSLQPAQGFWMTQRTGEAVSIDVSASIAPAALTASPACVSDNGCVEHALAATGNVSWTLVGAPFDTATAVSDIRLQAQNSLCEQGCSIQQAIDEGYTNGVFYVYDPQSSGYNTASLSDSLQPGAAYWFATFLEAQASDARLLLPVPGTVEPATSIFEKAARLGRGMNLGNALEAPVEGEWGITLEAYYFDRIADAGFNSVRVPARWSAHASELAPYTIEPGFFERIDWVIEQAERTGLAVVLNVHHYEALMESPDMQRERYLAIWDQIARRYSDRSEAVFFELLNEPTGVFNDAPAQWNDLLSEAVSTVRESNPSRALIVGPVGWNAIDRLPDLSLPLDDQLITTVHFYEPFAFTHQGAGWVDPVPPAGVSFDSTDLGLGGAYADWSWDTTVSYNLEGMQATFNEQFAAVNWRLLETDTPTQLRVEIAGPVELNVGCSQSGEFTFINEIIHASVDTGQYTIDLSACGSGIETVAMQSRLPGPLSITLVSGELCQDSICFPLLETEADKLRAQLAKASSFGVANNTPVFVGEFGAHNVGDLDSRADWTATVQQTINELGMTSAYWEFGAVFAAFDIANDQWIEPLREALLP